MAQHCVAKWVGKGRQSVRQKGDKLYIEGELRTRSYDDAQGVKRYITEIVATDMEMLTPKGTGAGTQAPPPPVPDAPAPDGTDDLPF